METGGDMFSNSERLVGRMYRNWLSGNRVIIQMVSYDCETGEVRQRWRYRPNDPLYLLEDHTGKKQKQGGW